MAYNTKSIVTDKDGNPVSQYFNPTADQYEPVLGAGGGNRVLVYKADGTESSVSLLPILDKLGQLTGTVIDEETRKSNELQRIALYNQIFNMLQAGELKGDKGDIGLTGKGLEFNWIGTQLGVRIQGDTEYIYVDLKGPKGDKGETGDMENLNAQHIEDALGYVPADEDIIGMLANLTTDEKANLVSAINEVKSQSNENATDLINYIGRKTVDLKQVARDLQIGGLQTISFNEKINGLLIYTNINGRKLSGIGATVGSGVPSFVMTTIETDLVSQSYFNSRPIIFMEAPTIYTEGRISITDKTVNITWTKGGGGATGNGNIYIIAFH